MYKACQEAGQKTQSAAIWTGLRYDTDAGIIRQEISNNYNEYVKVSKEKSKQKQEHMGNVNTDI